MLTALFVAIALAIVAFFIFFGTTRKAHSQGVLLPTAGIIRVVSTQVGVIKGKHVREGQLVRQGDILFSLTNERSNSTSTSAEKAISQLLQSRRKSLTDEIKLSSAQSQQRLDALLRRAADLRSEIGNNKDQIALQIRRISLVEQSYERFRALQSTNYISAAQLQDKQAEVLEQQHRMVELQRIKAGSERELDDTLADVQNIKFQAQRELSVLARDATEIEQDITETNARRELYVRAPQDGMVTAITADVGQTVGSSSALAALLPAGAELEAEIYAPSRSAGFIKPGMTVLLRYQAYPHQKFGQYEATVREVANTALRPEELSMTGTTLAPNALGEPLYRIRLKLDKQFVQAYGKPMPLKSGMVVDASVLLEHRRLYEWVLEPIFSVSGRL